MSNVRVRDFSYFWAFTFAAGRGCLPVAQNSFCALAVLPYSPPQLASRWRQNRSGQPSPPVPELLMP